MLKLSVGRGQRCQKKNLVVGLGGRLGVVLGVGLVSGLVAGLDGGLGGGLVASVRLCLVGLSVVLGVVLVAGLVAGLLAAGAVHLLLESGLSVGGIETRNIPNQGIHRSA